MLILNESDILKAIDFDELLKTVEQAFLLQEGGDYFMPDRMHLEYAGNTHLLMPAYTVNHFATKLVSVFPGNRKFDKPTVSGSVLLNDGQTGEPLALLNGSRLTALRTGAVGALGLAYTSPRGIRSIGLAGAGVQGFHLLLLACAVRNIEEIHILDPFHKDLSLFMGGLKAYLPGVKMMQVTTAERLVERSEAIIAATTSLSPVIPDDLALITGKHFIGIGSFRPEMQEFPETLLGKVDQVIIDTPLAMQESGDIAIPLKKGIIRREQIHTLGKLINGQVSLDENKTTLFKSVGMALFDLLTAKTIYTNALKNKIGQEVSF